MRSLDRTLLAVGAAFVLAQTGCGDPALRSAADNGSADRAPETLMGEDPAREIDPPAVDGALAPRWSSVAGKPLLSWIEPTATGHRLRFATFGSDGWSAPRTVAEGDDFFANWADTPTVVGASDGALRAHWLEKTSAATYSYSIAVSHSSDGGESWRRDGFLNEDSTLTEHGFVSTTIDREGRLAAVWLDGREMAEGGPMTLRVAREGEVSVAIDDRVCECCATSVAATDRGLIVAYRDRTEEEIRDVSIVRETAEGFSAPAPLHVDGWQIDGCPVNGPAIAADGDRVAVAWFTAPDLESRVSVSMSSDAGEVFGPPIVLDDADPLGRVATAWSGDHLGVAWLARGESTGIVRLTILDRSGRTVDSIEVAETAASRASGVPVLLAESSSFYVGWTESRDGEPLRLRARSIPAPS